MMEIYKFDKNFQQRLAEYTDILCSHGSKVSASQIHSEWSYHVELVIEPVGWQALWKISRLVCQDFNIDYPTVVVVMVEQVDFADLSALVKITAVQEDIHLPAKYDVPLIELFPTHDQENNVLDIIGTANCVDQLRFFYNYLWMPWDAEEDDDVDWVEVHLETRIRLFFDMKSGAINNETCNIIKNLVQEGKEIQDKISRLENAMSDDEEEDVVDVEKVYQLMELRFKMQVIKTELDILEDPAVREMVIKKRREICIKTNNQVKINENKTGQIEAYFVWLGGPLEKMIEAFNTIQKFLPQSTFLRTFESLQENLEVCNVGSIILLGEGSHQITSTGRLENGGTIRGLQNVENTIVCAKGFGNRPSVFDFSGDEVLLENISINLEEKQVGIIARKGVLKIVGCKIYASNYSSTRLGIVVLSGAKLLLENISFEGLGTAIVNYSSGEVVMNKCSFKNCTEGIQLQDDAKLEAKECLLGHFQRYAIRLETDKYTSGLEVKFGGMELLNGVTEVSLHDCKFECNGKSDVILKPRSAVTVMVKHNDSITC